MCIMVCIELIITSDGHNIPPMYIEESIKSKVPFLSNVMVVGDNRKYLTCLLTLKVRNVYHSHWIVILFLYLVCHKCRHYGSHR